jgi:putative tricarboxylic transport membrane protein
MKKADLITGFVLLVLSGYVIWESWMMPSSATFGPGSGFLPFWLGVLMALLALILLFSAWRRPRDPKEGSPFPGGKPLLRVAAVMVGLGVYISLMEVLGFLLNTFLFVSYLLGFVERERLPMTALVAFLTTAGLYLIFQVVLGITLPRNMFGL